MERTSRNVAELLIEEGFDDNEFHVCCHPPHGYFTSVSIMGLRSYVEDDQVLEALALYGEIKSDILRLKYRKDHELAGIENGNRLVKMVLASKSIPYSMKIGANGANGAVLLTIIRNQLVQNVMRKDMRGEIARRLNVDFVKRKAICLLTVLKRM